MKQQLLVEIGCEELPPKALTKLSRAFFDGVKSGLEKAGIEFDADNSRMYNSPRRLAFSLAQVAAKQADQTLKRRGPAISAAFDADDKPTPAAIGFARSVNMDLADIGRSADGQHLFVEVAQPGQALSDVLYPILQDALKRLPVPKPMRWGDHQDNFVRPVHWLLVLFGDQVVEGELFEHQAGRLTYGHRVHAPGPHSIEHAEQYVEALDKAFVMVEPEARKARVKEQSIAVAEKQNAYALIDESLLEEVTNLLEWPVALAGSFDTEFLQVPAEALISSMQSHQKFFPMLAAKADPQLINQFITVANLESTAPEVVRQGFERVISPRLADARFFWDQDRKHGLESWIPALGKVVFQKKLGTIADKCKRMSAISHEIAKDNDLDLNHTKRAAELCKCDLMSEMVGEFPDLQGIMGRYYATEAGEDPAVAEAIEQHYQPRFASDIIPASPLGRVLALADRIDTLVGIFAIGQKPTGTKDPFALRRAALGIIRILQHGQPDYPLDSLLALAAKQYGSQLEVSAESIQDLHDFVLERMRHHYQSEDGFKAPLVNAVAVVQRDDLRDFDQRIRALAAFMQRPEADSLAAANKRIRNILRKADVADLGGSINPQDQAEKELHKACTQMREKVSTLVADRKYGEALDKLASLKPQIDDFFEAVMVMAEEQPTRQSRLALVAELKQLFSQVADFSALA